jgi:hypothetical protein
MLEQPPGVDDGDADQTTGGVVTKGVPFRGLIELDGGGGVADMQVQHVGVLVVDDVVEGEVTNGDGHGEALGAKAVRSSPLILHRLRRRAQLGMPGQDVRPALHRQDDQPVLRIDGGGEVGQRRHGRDGNAGWSPRPPTIHNPLASSSTRRGSCRAGAARACRGS